MRPQLTAAACYVSVRREAMEQTSVVINDCAHVNYLFVLLRGVPGSISEGRAVSLHYSSVNLYHGTNLSRGLGARFCSLNAEFTH
jgi:hypothetical protein